MSLDEAIIALDNAVADFLNGPEDENSKILSAAFAVNNEIGKAFGARGDKGLKDLQRAVNDVVVATKRRDRVLLSTAMERLRAMLRRSWE